jgi:hypothetical protein
MAHIRKRILVAACGFFLLPFQAGLARAQLSLTYTPDPVTYGCAVTYTVTGKPPAGYKLIGAAQWRYRSTDCNSGFTPYQADGLATTYIEIFVGSFEVQALLTIQQQGTALDPNPPLRSLTVAAFPAVPPPDGISLPTITTLYGDITGNFTLWNFPVTCAGRAVCTLPGVAFESLTEKSDINGDKEADQIRITGGFMDISDGSIWEQKGFRFTGKYAARYAGLSNGHVLTRFKQKYYVELKDFCGNPKIYDLGPRLSVRATKTGAATYQFEIQSTD